MATGENFLRLQGNGSKERDKILEQAINGYTTNPQILALRRELQYEISIRKMTEKMYKDECEWSEKIENFLKEIGYKFDVEKKEWIPIK